MAFKSNIDYVGYQGQRGQAERAHTKALYEKKKEDERKAREAAAAAAAAATRRSGQRSGLQKLGSAVARGAAAYYTGGASEALGFGGAIDDVILGKDDQGNSIRNEYGELVRAGSGIYGAMKSRKAGDVARKRASNVQDYNEQVALATEMGKLDPVLGKDMLQQARDTRYAQKQQTQAGEDASVWGWDNEFGTLTPSQQAGAIEAQEIQDSDLPNIDTTSVTVPDFQKEGSDSRIKLANIKADRRNMANQGPSMDEVESMYERDRKQAFMDNPDLDSPRTPSTRLNERFHKQRQMEDMMDREYNKKILDERGASFAGAGSGISNAELEANVSGKNALVEAQNKIPSYFEPTYKTYSEKEAEKLSRMDDHRPTALDELAIGEKVKNLKKQSFLERLFDRSEGEKQLLLEDELNKKRALAREQARTRGPHGNAMRKGSYYNPYESPLLKRMRARRQKANEVALKRGGILAAQ